MQEDSQQEYIRLRLNTENAQLVENLENVQIKCKLELLDELVQGIRQPQEPVAVLKEQLIGLRLRYNYECLYRVSKYLFKKSVDEVSQLIDETH
jgi:hypothetical protein